MELDTGSSISVISEADYVKYFKGEKLEKSLLVLKTYSGEKLHSLGVMRVQVQYNAQCSYLNLYVVKRGGPALFGREWLKSIQLDWRTKEETSFSDKRDSCEVIYGKRLTFMLESSTPVCKRHCDELSDGYCISKV
jgi:predicted transcriptional regulator